MIFHVFNSSLISGPETLVIPALAHYPGQVEIIWLREARVAAEKQAHVEDYFRKYGIRWTTIEIHSRWDREAVEKMTNFLQTRNEEIEVVHAHDVKPSFYVLAAAERVKNRKFSIVSTHHGVRARSGFMVKLYELYYSYFTLPKFDRVLVVCSEDRKRLLQRGLSPDLVKVHLNGVDRVLVTADERAQKQKEIRARWGLAEVPGQLVFGVLARLEKEKDHKRLLDMVKKVRQMKPDLSFVVLCFGRGSLEERLKHKTEEMGLQDVILWKGYRSGLGDELAGFDALISVSRAEGLPINLIEAGWAATPVFSSDVDGVKDLVSSPELGTLFADTSATSVIASRFVEFSSNPERLKAQGKSFQAHVVKNFSQDIWMQHLLNSYQELR